MQRPWLTLAVLVAFVAAAAGATVMEEHQVEPARALRYFPCYRPGCYSSISGLGQNTSLEGCLEGWHTTCHAEGQTCEPAAIPEMEPEPKPTFQPRFPDWQQQPHLEEKPTEEVFLSILQHLKAASMWDRRAKRNTRKTPPARRRGKQREGARPVCRGCYSGLTIVAPQEGKNESLKWSHSASDEDSSGGY